MHFCTKGNSQTFLKMLPLQPKNTSDMLKRRTILAAFLLLSMSAGAQNAVQETDTILNYTDINGLKQGHWIAKYQNGKTRYEAYFVDGQPIGEFKKYDSYGNLNAILNYSSDGSKADARFFHRSGKISATGKYVGHEKDSIWLYYADNGILYLQESYKKGVKDGLFIQYTSERKKIEEVTWKDGEKHGPWRKYYVTGAMMFDVNYDHGKLNGEGKVYYANGKLQKKGKYVNDLMEGSWLQFDEHGNYVKQYVYKHGYCKELADEQNRTINEMESHKDEWEDPAEHMNDPTWLMR